MVGISNLYIFTQRYWNNFQRLPRIVLFFKIILFQSTNAHSPFQPKLQLIFGFFVVMQASSGSKQKLNEIVFSWMACAMVIKRLFHTNKRTNTMPRGWVCWWHGNVYLHNLTHSCWLCCRRRRRRRPSSSDAAWSRIWSDASGYSLNGSCFSVALAVSKLKSTVVHTLWAVCRRKLA